MGATLQVDPNRLVTAAAEHTEAGEFISGLAAGTPMSAATSGMATLVSGAACQFAADALNTAADAVGGELSAYAAALSTAADHYRRTDAELSRRLARPAE